MSTRQCEEFIRNTLRGPEQNCNFLNHRYLPAAINTYQPLTSPITLYTKLEQS